MTQSIKASLLKAGMELTGEQSRQIALDVSASLRDTGHLIVKLETGDESLSLSRPS